MPEPQAVLAVDLGTTACKVALVTPRGRVLAHIRESDATPTHFLPGGGAEQNPEAWWAVITRLSRQLLEMTRFPRHQVMAVACSAHWSGTVAVDREGRVLYPAILWMDTRGATYVRRITSGPITVEGYGLDKLFWWIRLTGGIPTRSGKDTLAHILFLKYEKPEVYRATYKFLEPKDYLNLRLTGRFATDFATVILYWVTDNRDPTRIAYHPRLMRMAGIDPEKLPDLYPTTHILGRLLPGPAEELGVPAGLPVLMGMPDFHAPGLGSGAVADYEAHLYVGTSSWVSCHVPFKKTDLFHNMASLPAVLPGRYFIAAEQETAGATLTFLRNTFFYAQDTLETGPAPQDAYPRMDALAAQSPPGSQGIRFFPWLYGERTPVEDPYLRAAWVNLSLDHTRADAVRAVLEGVALNTRWLLTHVEAFAGRRFTHLRFVGGGARSEVWSQIFADVLQRPIWQMEEPDLVGVRALGLLAGIALLGLSPEDAAQEIPVRRIYEPSPEAVRVYDEAFRSFLDFHRRMKGWYRRWSPVARA